MFILRKIYAFLVETLQSILIAASIFLVIYIFLFRPFQVNGESMYPNFWDHEYVLTNLIGLQIGNPKLGDVVVFQSPTDKERDFIKRIIGIPGDTVMIAEGDVYLNGKKLDENAYLSSKIRTYGQQFLPDNQTIIVPQDQYFVMGDNRPYSSDSREWGFVKKSQIIGLSFYVYFPFNRMRLVTNPFGEKK